MGHQRRHCQFGRVVLVGVAVQCWLLVCHRRAFAKVSCEPVRPQSRSRSRTPVEKLQRLKKVKDAATWQWSKYCADEGGGVRDPRQHPDEFVLEFLDRDTYGMLPKVELASEELVGEINAFLRSGGQDAMKAWNSYSYAQGFGIKDPRLNAASFVRRFLEQHTGVAAAHVQQTMQSLHETRTRSRCLYDFEGFDVVFIPPLPHAAQAESGADSMSDPPAVRRDGTVLDATPSHRYVRWLRGKVRKALHVLQQGSMPIPKEIEVYESARSGFRMRSFFDVVFWDDDMIYRQSDVYVRHHTPGTRKMNEVLKAVRKYVLDVDALRQNLHQVFVHTSSRGDAVIMLTYYDVLTSGWHDAASSLRDAEGFPVVGLAFSSDDARGPRTDGRGRSWWASRQGRALVDRDWILEQFVSGGQLLEYQQVIGLFSQPNHGVCQQMLFWAENRTRSFKGDLLELYCGSGCFTLALAHNFRRCLGTEISPDSIHLARSNAARNHIGNVEFVRKNSSELSQALLSSQPILRDSDVEVALKSYDFRTVLVDPTRNGLDIHSRELAQRFDNVVYISCNPRTLTRDIGELSDTHTVTAFALFDQFPYTDHVECGAVLARKKTAD